MCFTMPASNSAYDAWRKLTFIVSHTTPVEIGLKNKIIEEDAELQDLILLIHHTRIPYFNKANSSKLYTNQRNVSII